MLQQEKESRFFQVRLYTYYTHTRPLLLYTGYDHFFLFMLEN